MQRHRLVARQPGGKGYTVELVRFLTDAQALGRVNMHKAQAAYKDTLSVDVYRESFNAQGMTTERVKL